MLKIIINKFNQHLEKIVKSIATLGSMIMNYLVKPSDTLPHKQKCPIQGTGYQLK